MLGQRRRRWPNIKTPLGQRLVSAGCVHTTVVPGICETQRVAGAWLHNVIHV